MDHDGRQLVDASVATRLAVHQNHQVGGVEAHCAV
jgi:hypothetical protein